MRFAALLLGLSLVAACTPAAISSDNPSALAGTSWRLVNIASGGTVMPALGSPAVTLSFNADGRVSGSAGCNRFAGSFTQDGSRLTFGPLASTKMACADDAANRQEVTYLQVLSAAASFSRNGDGLVITTATGDGLRFTATTP